MSNSIVCQGEKNKDNQEESIYCHICKKKLEKLTAPGSNYICSCGSELIQEGSERQRELIGMEDQKFIEKFLPQILKK